MKVYPVPGRRVRDPVTKQFLTASGLDVPETDLFWARRLRDEDVTLTVPKTDEAPTAPAAEQESASATHAGGEQS
ncbi:DUF2635 domain-containing protein [Paraburkholderia silviterrae]|uniref:DUF2635 domain-containing protein n=1 Tax=Paraburkholderia silviterrae TaxID=2528715 RepID=A0A4R5M9D6_9BURK|nr:DUF2635 domain-containing protein [Paraburkholderia silviterrae]TDG23219.1 DUF2635 domain-containing protein [Paraburkholderia silviterrae]